MMLIKNIDNIRDNVDITYNVLFEMFACLSLLTEPEGFNHNQWAKEVRDKLPQELLHKLDFWGEFERWYFALDVITANGLLWIKTPRLFFKGIQELSVDSVLNNLWIKPQAWLEDNEKEFRRFSASEENYNTVVGDPDEYVEDLKSFLQEFYFCFFESISSQVEFCLMQAVNEKLNVFAKGSIGKLFNSFGRKFNHRDEDLFMKGWQNKEYTAGKDLNRIILMPTIFSAPHLLMDDEIFDKTMFIAFPVLNSPFLDVRDISDDEIAFFAGTFRALGDPNRLKILLSLDRKPACNQDLVKELQISQAAVSKHLTRLRLYNLIEGEEVERNRVMYQLSNIQMIEVLRHIGLLESRSNQEQNQF